MTGDAAWPEVDVFASLMRRELTANGHKGRWEGLSSSFLLAETYVHLGKLSEAVTAGDIERVAEHAADVANLSMMVASVAGVPLSPVSSCSCDGCWACSGHERGCTCDVDWERVYGHSGSSARARDLGGQ